MRVCYDNGVVRIYEAGRYAVNSPTFVVGGTINIQQQNLRFSEHRVLLDGALLAGISRSRSQSAMLDPELDWVGTLPEYEC